jgi:cytochrome c-type biogenesis protein CcmH
MSRPLGRLPGRLLGRPVSSRALAGALVLGLLVLTAVVVVRHGSRPATLDARVEAVAATLKCPSCEAESVSASNAPIAQSMRAEIRTQLRQGRTPDQVRAWFQQRYGSGVVLVPRSSGSQLVLWLTPFLVLAGGAVLLLGRRRVRAGPATGEARVAGVSRPRLALAAVTVLAVGAAVPLATRMSSSDTASAAAPAAGSSQAAPAPRAGMGAGDWVDVGRSLDGQQDYIGATKAYRRALKLAPGSASVRIRLALDLVRDQHAADAEPLVRTLARTGGPSQSAALLVLGLAQRAQGEAAARGTLHRFLALAPGHPAAAQVRRLLARGP